MISVIPLLAAISIIPIDSAKSFEPSSTPGSIWQCISQIKRKALQYSYAPKAKDPVSPIKTLAGLILNIKNPSKEPTIRKAKIAISS